jgi:putative phosphoribosyl transferase
MIKRESNNTVDCGLVKIPILEHPLGQEEVTILLEANLNVPQGSEGIIIFVHGSGNGRHSQRNRSVAGKLNEDGLATLLLDLLTIEEERIDNQTRQFRFDIGSLSKRLVFAIDWIMTNPVTKNLSIGLFGASTGAAAALVAAAERGAVSAIVSRGGRPDLAGKDILRRVHAPTLLLVGGNDEEVLNLNENALKDIKAEKKKLTIIPGATHLFEEPGKLEQVARIASGWFRCYFLIQKRGN